MKSGKENKMAGLKFTGFGAARGETTVTNEEMRQYVDTNDAWIRKKTGIHKRNFAFKKSNCDMAVEASETALKNAGTDPSEIDAVIVCTATPDRTTPSVANETASRLGMREDILSMDLNGACSGFIYGCITANALLCSHSCRKVLIVGSERLSQVINMKDRSTCVLFGDGAGAAVAEYLEDGFFKSLSGLIYNDHALYCSRFDPALSMAGQEVYHFAVSKVPEATEKILAQSDLSAEDIDWFIFHQANERIIDSAASKLHLDEEKCFKNIADYGNTSAASIAIALGEMQEKKLLQPGMKIVCVGFGAGLTYGAIATEL
jgi:3-oxoacyl-[acyl-carrier-protein] synthase-3